MDYVRNLLPKIIERCFLFDWIHLCRIRTNTTHRNTRFTQLSVVWGFSFFSLKKESPRQRFPPLKTNSAAHYSNLSMNTNRVPLRMTCFCPLHKLSWHPVRNVNEVLVSFELFLSLLMIYRYPYGLFVQGYDRWQIGTTANQPHPWVLSETNWRDVVSDTEETLPSWMRKFL